MEIHLKIKAYRESKNIVQSYMAEKMDISLVSYSKIERGITELSVKRLYEIAEILGVNVAELLGIEVLDSNQAKKIKELEWERDIWKQVVKIMSPEYMKKTREAKTMEEADYNHASLSNLIETLANSKESKSVD